MILCDMEEFFAHVLCRFLQNSGTKSYLCKICHLAKRGNFKPLIMTNYNGTFKNVPAKKLHIEH